VFVYTGSDDYWHRHRVHSDQRNHDAVMETRGSHS